MRIVETEAMDAYADARLTADEFLEWMAGPSAPEGRWELVAGVPVRMMVNVRWGHSAVVGNLMRHLGNDLAGKPGRAHAESFGVKTREDGARFPDVLVSCKKERDRDVGARDTRVVIEVLSDGTRTFDKSQKLEEYQRVSTIQHIVFIEAGIVDVNHFVRAAEGWRRVDLDQFEDVLELSAVDASVGLKDIYEDLDVPPPGPRLRVVRDE